MDKRALLSSTAPLPPLECPTAVQACDLQSGRQYTIIAPAETPHVITFKDLKETLERADKQRAERRYLTPAEQQEIWENRFRPIPTEDYQRTIKQFLADDPPAPTTLYERRRDPGKSMTREFFRSIYMSTFGEEPRPHEVRLFEQLRAGYLTTRRK